MPYDSIVDLLDDAQINFPKRAREIYKEAYDKTWDEYEGSADKQDLKSRETAAHNVAWNAVESKYEKGEDGEWRRKG